MRIQGIRICLYFYLIYPTCIIGLWWAVGSPLVMDPNSICRKTRRLAGKQRAICRKEPEIVEEVANGAKLALMECQYQFRHRRWNCTTTRRSIPKILRRDTREAAFVYAITAAGVVFAVTEACSAGRLRDCPCDKNNRHVPTNGEFEWGGCGDKVGYGYQKSRQFMDARKRKKRRGDVTTLIRLHNNEAGRLAVTSHMRTECKCHGLSGSCTLKTCWKKMPLFRTVGDILKIRFNGSTKVIISNDGKGLIPAGETIKPPVMSDLVYSEESPDFCKRNKRLGSLGTKHRECDPDSRRVNGCAILCCDRGYTKREVTVKKNCKCQFIWCCEVECETCVSVETVHRCL